MSTGQLQILGLREPFLFQTFMFNSAAGSEVRMADLGQAARPPIRGSLCSVRPPFAAYVHTSFGGRCGPWRRLVVSSVSSNFEFEIRPRRGLLSMEGWTFLFLFQNFMDQSMPPSKVHIDGPRGGHRALRRRSGVGHF